LNRKRAIIPIWLLLMFLACLDFSRSSDECGAGRLYRVKGMQRLLQSSSALAPFSKIGAQRLFSLPTMAMPQRKENNEQTRASSVTAPGSDPSRFVPGTSVDSYGLTEYFHVGALRFRPSARVSYLYQSNRYAESGIPGEEYYLQVAPTIELLLPISQNGIRLDYTAAYNRFKNEPSLNRFSHNLNMDSKIDLSPILSLSVRDHYAINSMDAREYVPGRELIFSDSRFWRNELETQVDWAVTEDNNLGITGGYNTVHFKDSLSERALPMYDYRQYALGGFYRRRISQRTSLYGDGSYLRNLADDPRGISSYSGFEALGGIESFLTPLISGQLSLGLRRENYPGSSLQQFNGLVLRGNLQKEITENSRISFAVDRTSNLSNFEQNPYYTTNGIAVNYVREVNRQFAFSISPGYQRNSYPLPLEESLKATGLSSDTHRLDNILELDANARYRHNAWLALDFQFGFLRRHSNLPDLSFTDYRAAISLLVGMRGLTQGRAPY
jgi:hypothetical protein